MAFDRLLADFPADIAPAKFPWNMLDWQKKVQLAEKAVAPVWVTVRVPADAPAGVYKGTLTIDTFNLTGTLNARIKPNALSNDVIFGIGPYEETLLAGCRRVLQSVAVAPK